MFFSGNMWAQDWSNIEELGLPYPDVPPGNITKSLIEQVSRNFLFSNIPQLHTLILISNFSSLKDLLKIYADFSKNTHKINHYFHFFSKFYKFLWKFCKVFLQIFWTMFWVLSRFDQIHPKFDMKLFCKNFFQKFFYKFVPIFP